MASLSNTSVHDSLASYKFAIKEPEENSEKFSLPGAVSETTPPNFFGRKVVRILDSAPSQDIPDIQCAKSSHPSFISKKAKLVGEKAAFAARSVFSKLRGGKRHSIFNPKRFNNRIYSEGSEELEKKIQQSIEFEAK